MLATEVGSRNFHMANSRGAYYVREKKKSAEKLNANQRREIG